MHGRALVLLASATLASIALLACGGDDGDSDGGDASSTTAATSAAATQESTADGGGSDGTDAGGGMMTEILGGLWGLPPNFITEDQRTCMNDELAKSYPEGLPANYATDEELIDAVDAAAVTCNVVIG